MDQPTAEEALRRLEPLVGEWTFEATWPNGEVWPGGGRGDGNTITARWEIAEDGTNYSTDFDLVYRRSQPTPGMPVPDDAL